MIIMGKKLIAIIIISILFSNIAMAQTATTYNVEFDIQSDLTVVETVEIEFNQSVLASDLAYSDRKSVV